MTAGDLEQLLMEHRQEFHPEASSKTFCFGATSCNQALLLRGADFERERIAKGLEALYVLKVPTVYHRIALPYVHLVRKLIFPQGVV